MALTFGMETREDTVQFRRRTSFSGTIGRSTINSPSPRKTVLILVRGQSVRARLVRTRSSSCPGGVGFRGIAACGEGASPLPGPLPPRRFSPRSTARVRRGYSAITRTDMGVQQSLNLADSQPGTQCTHVVVCANGARPPLSLARRYRELPPRFPGAGQCKRICGGNWFVGVFDRSTRPGEENAGLGSANVPSPGSDVDSIHEKNVIGMYPASFALLAGTSPRAHVRPSRSGMTSGITIQGMYSLPS